MKTFIQFTHAYRATSIGLLPMCGVDVMQSLQVSLAALALALPTMGFSQGFGGSFDNEPAPAQTQESGSFGGGSFDGGTTSGGSVDNGGSSFGGSFGDDASTTIIGGQTPGSASAGPTVGGDDFNGGSFDPVQPGPGTATPQPPVDPVQPDPSPQQQGIVLDPQIFAFETRDFGVQPTNQLRNGQLHAATPTAIPGGQLVSTEALANAMNSGMQIVLIDVLGGQYSLPGAFVAPGLAQPGNYQDRNQQQAAQWLQQITQGQRDVPIVVFCSDPQCWLSYNASLRTINAGYSQVYWYRGGLQAWQMGGLPMRPASY